MVILKISASFFIEAGVFSFSELGLMRGATLFFFLALLVVVGTGRGVCLKSNLNNVVMVEEELVARCWFFRQIRVKTFDICFKCVRYFTMCDGFSPTCLSMRGRIHFRGSDTS